MYTESSIQQIRDIAIDQIVGKYATVKRSGRLFECISPFNPNEKTPSFKMDPAKNNFVCYSTQKKGDGIRFIEEIEACTFYEAVTKLGSMFGITLDHEAETPEVTQRREAKAGVLQVLKATAQQYQKALGRLPKDHWAVQTLASRNISPEICAEFGIGFSPESGKFITDLAIEKGVLEPAKSAQLVRTDNGRSYDFFRNRIMFPIEDANGNVLGFGARCADDDPSVKGKKYINSAASDVYNKTRVLYGLAQAKKCIQSIGHALLVEGYTDVTSMHQFGVCTAVNTCGTALSPEQAQLLKRFTKHVVVCRDNDGYKEDGTPGAGTKATLRDIDILLAEGLQVSVVILPEKQDAHDFAQTYGRSVAAGEETAPLMDILREKFTDAVQWKATWLKNHAANDEYKLAEAFAEACKMIPHFKDDYLRKVKIDQVAKIFKMKAGDVTAKLNEFTAKAEEGAKRRGNDYTAEDLGLPEGADPEEFLKTGFCTIGNAYWFRSKDGFFMGTNYRVTPLFHVAGNIENKRLCEIVNINNEKRLIDLDSKDLVNQTQFEARLLDLGNFIFTASLTSSNFRQLKQTLVRDFTSANEISDLGWQDQGFFAYADCIYHNGTIKRVNNYGIVTLDVPAKKASDYHAQSQCYYLPAYSEMHRYDSSAGDQYENDRYCVYRPTEVTLNQWMLQLYRVYGEKAILGIAFCVASLHRDLFQKMYQYFPHMFLSGEKGSGKSKFGESLAALFTYKQPAFDLNAGTPVAFYRRLARFTNSLTMMEEYHDNIDAKIFQALKGAADGRGREMGKATGDNKTMSTKVNTALIILGQYLSARDDNSLTTRSILGHFIKRQEAYTNEDIESYTTLKSWEERGLNALISEILQYRDIVEKNLHPKYNEISRRMKKDLEGKPYEQRVLDTYITLLAPMEVLWDKFTFPFSKDDMWKLCREAITDSSDLIVESEGLSVFWNILMYLVNKEPYASLTDGKEFMVCKIKSLSLQTRKGEKDEVWVNDSTPLKRVLLLRLNMVHQLYAKEALQRQADVITEATMKNYFRSKKYFLGSIKSIRFGGVSTSAYAFDYEMMEAQGILNLDRYKKDDATFEATTDDGPELPLNGEKNDDLPF